MQSITRRTEPPKEVLHVGEVETPQPGPGEVRIRLKTSGVNPSDVKNRAGTARKIAFPRVIPHSDGAGEIDAVGAGVAEVAHRRAGVDLERRSGSARSAPRPNTSCCRRGRP